MARHRLTDAQWELIEDVFPEPAATGRPPVNPRDIDTQAAAFTNT